MKDYVSPEVYFAQHLASNDNKIRNRAVKKLRAWLTMRSSAVLDFTEEDILKIWKGLFYCMWMCDKPLNQEKLADNISELVHCFTKPRLCMRFIDTFFQSMSKEWHGIDRYRIEKYMLLVRRFLCQCFCVVSKTQWNPKLLLKLLKVLRKHIINPLRDDTPPGLKMHVIDIYLDEVAKAGGCDLKPKKLNKVLKPYIMFLSVCDESLQLNAVVKGIFHPLIWQAFHEDDSDDESTEDAEETVSYQVDFNALADLLLKHVSSKEKITTKNQKIVYKLVAQLRSTARGEFPFQNVDSEDDNDEYKLTRKDIDRAARKLVVDDLKIKEERRERIKEIRDKRKRRRKETEGLEGKEVEESGSDLDELNKQLETSLHQEYKSEKKHKRKKKPIKGKIKNKKGKQKGKVKASKIPRRKKFQKKIIK